MRILHIITTINRGGAENHLTDLIQGQVRSYGCAVTCAYLQGNGYWAPALEALGVRVIPLNLTRYGEVGPLWRLRDALSDPGNPDSVSLEQIADWKQEGSVILLDHVDHIEKIMPQIDIGVLPSYREGLPSSLLEAAACGLPIVTTDVPGCREVVIPGVNGLLVPPGDPVALANAIEYLLKHPEERCRMGAAGRARVLATFDERIILQETIAVYRELLDARQ